MSDPSVGPPVCVAGMHRSGTSMVARMLGACGFYLGGEDELMPPSSDNPDGFFEHLGVVGVNEALLAELGGGWDCPPPMPEGWEKGEGLSRQRTRALGVLNGLAGGAGGGPWGWKDPRTSLTLPFWRSLVPGLRVVVCVRNPLEVALSLRLRNHFSYALGLTLWEAYYRLLLGAVPEGERLLTHYDRYFREPREELERVLGFLGIDASEEAVQEAVGAAAVGMRHGRFSAAHLWEFGVSREIAGPYARMCEEAGWPDGGAAVVTDLASKGEGVGAKSEARGGIGGVDGGALEALLLRRELEAASTEIAARGEAVASLGARLEEVEARAEELAERLLVRDGTVRELRRQLVAAQGELETLREASARGGRRSRKGAASPNGAAATAAGEPGSLFFRCNVCGKVAVARVEDLDREVPSCKNCGSSVRFRFIVHALSMELFGESLALPDFPERPDIKGIGMSDWAGYATPLAQKFDYTNTYFHKEPKLDISAGEPSLEGTLDFVISTEVFEHVVPPVSVAFQNVRKLLKPTGVLIFTVPYGKGDKTAEHFPDLHDYEVVETNGGYVLKNVTKDGELQVFDDLIFHGGPGATLEMRLFSESSLFEEFEAAGFGNVKIYRGPDFNHGVYQRQDWSLPMAARIS